MLVLVCGLMAVVFNMAVVFTRPGRHERAAAWSSWNAKPWSRSRLADWAVINHTIVVTTVRHRVFLAQGSICSHPSDIRSG